MEKWKEIKIGGYEISTLGEVRNKKTGKLLKSHLSTRGYLRIGLYIDGKRKRFGVHRLVAEAFLKNPDNKPEVDHKNRIKTDNRLVNLRYATSVENKKNIVKINKEIVSEIIALHKQGYSDKEVYDKLKN